MNALGTLTQRLTLPYRRGGEFATLTLGDDAADGTPVLAHGFEEYRARWGEYPRDITYVLAPRQDVGGDDLAVTLSYNEGVADTLTMIVPRGTPAGTGFVVPLKGTIDASLQITGLTVLPAVDGPGKNAWELTALLGNIARLSWLIGAEKGAIARVGKAVAGTRFVKTTFGAGLDALGRDMRVPRFPPRPYSLDADTVGLWHLDETGGAAVVDETTHDLVVGHPGAVTGAHAGAPGKYGTGFAFSATGATTIAVAASADLDIAADADATIEAFVLVATADATPRAILARRASEAANGSAAPGWSLAVMDARGIAGNVYFAVCDGISAETRLFGDVSLADGAFHHVAGIIDRQKQRARLFVDGVQRASAPIDTLQQVAPPDALRFGTTTAGNPFGGTIDEVRLSRVARTTFHPALGEDDDAYRARLKLFRRWVLPTPENTIAMVNEAAPMPGEPEPYELVEANQPTQTVEMPVRIVPKTLPVGTAIALDGTAPRDEAIAGTPADDAGFDPLLDLIAYHNVNVDALADPGHGMMQAGAARLLDALVAAAGGRFILEHSFDPAGPTPLHGVGRALRLRHQTMPADQLGALAHRIGFPYVRNLGADLAVAVSAGERLAIVGAPQSRADAGTTFDLSIQPTVPSAGIVTWTIVTPGPGKAHFAAHPGDPVPPAPPPLNSRRQLQLIADAPGDIAVRVEYSLRGRTRSGTLALRIDPVSIADGHAIDAVGNPDPDRDSIVGSADAGFDPLYLVSHPAVTGVSFATADSTKMQPATRDALDALIALLAARSIAGDLKVAQAYVSGGIGVEGVGRRVVLGHSTLDQGVLAALAAQSFDYVFRGGGQVVGYVRPGGWVGVRLSPDAPFSRTIGLGDTVTITGNAGLPTGTYNWSTRSIGNGAGTFRTVTQPVAQFTASRTGTIMLVLTYVETDETRAAPYSFEIRLKPALDVPATTIPKPQYDIIMNVLDTFHPIGVEVKTDNLRPHVREIESDPKKAFPGYSFPNFRF